MVEGENNQSRMYFGRCIVFFEDANDQLFIGVRWYEAADEGDSLIDAIVHLAKLKLSPANNTRSYGIMPAGSIRNGALILKTNDHYWALQSPREDAEYVNKNVTF